MIEDTTETMSPSSDTPLEEPSDEDTSAPHGHSEAPAEEDTPIVSAVEQAEELHDLADQAAAEGRALEELGDRAGAEEIVAAGLEAAETAHVVGNQLAEDVVVEAGVEAEVLEGAAQELGDELVAEATEQEQELAEAEPAE